MYTKILCLDLNTSESMSKYTIQYAYHLKKGNIIVKYDDILL